MDKWKIEYWRDQLDERWLEIASMQHKGKSIDQAVNESFVYLAADEQRLENSDINDFKKLVSSWLSNKRSMPIKPVMKKWTLDDLR